MAVSGSATPVTVGTVQAFFADHRDQLKEFATGALARLLHMEKSVAVSFWLLLHLLWFRHNPLAFSS